MRHSWQQSRKPGLPGRGDAPDAALRWRIHHGSVGRGLAPSSPSLPSPRRRSAQDHWARQDQQTAWRGCLKAGAVANTRVISMSPTFPARTAVTVGRPLTDLRGGVPPGATGIGSGPKGARALSIFDLRYSLLSVLLIPCRIGCIFQDNAVAITLLCGTAIRGSSTGRCPVVQE